MQIINTWRSNVCSYYMQIKTLRAQSSPAVCSRDVYRKDPRRDKWTRQVTECKWRGRLKSTKNASSNELHSTDRQCPSASDSFARKNTAQEDQVAMRVVALLTQWKCHQSEIRSLRGLFENSSYPHMASTETASVLCASVWVVRLQHALFLCFWWAFGETRSSMCSCVWNEMGKEAN